MPNLIDENEEKIDTKVDTSVYQTKPKNKKKSRWWWSTLILFLVIFLIGIGFLSKIVLAINSTNSESGEKINFFDQIRHLIINPEKNIIGQEEDRINILLAGIGGSGHDGAYLADTIIIASVKPSTKEVATISIPRDLYVEIPEYGWRKINNALAFGYIYDYPGGGELLLKETIENLLDIPIHYYARIDFDGFSQVIDDVGGLDIYVENSFTDYSYPDNNYGYQTISFTEGLEEMDGDRALKYVRSRKGTNGEGSDFARSRRQQIVLLALRDKLVSLNTLLNPSKIVTILDNLGKHNQTNLEIWEILELGKMVQGLEQDSIITSVLDNGPNGLLVSDHTIDGAYILKPEDGDFTAIKYMVDNIFDNTYINKENARIEIQNSTKVVGLASKTADKLEALNYTIAGIGNADTETPLERTTIYDLSGGTNPYTVINIKNMLNADISSSLPPFMVESHPTYQALIAPTTNSNLNTNEEEVDILIVIGSDQITTRTTE